MIGVVCAMPEELTGLAGTAEEHTPLDAGFARMTLGGSEVVVAGDGLGKVQAAMTATTMIERFGCTALVCAGTAGGLSGAKPLDVLIGTRLIQHDYGRSRGAGRIELYKPGVPPLPENLGDDFALELPPAQIERYRAALADLAFVRFGTFASGDTFINDDVTCERLTELGANAVDMECAAVAQVADFYGVPWLVAKGISDTASDLSHEAFLKGLVEAARRSATVISVLLPHMA